MKVEDIVKALSEASVDSAIITAVKGLDNSAEVERLTGELKAEQGKSASILADKHKFKEAAEAHEAKIKELSDSNLTVDEKWQAQINELKKVVETERAEKEAEKQARATEKRESEMMGIAGKYNPAKGVTRETLNSLVKMQLTDIEDLSDETSVGSKIKDLMENNKGLFAADVPAGDGSQHGAGGSADNNGPKDMIDLMPQNWN